MPGFMPAIHAFLFTAKRWMALKVGIARLLHLINRKSGKPGLR
jgi:hypothetical protein